MTMSKLVLIIFFSAILICSTFTQNVEATPIGYPAFQPNLPIPSPPTPVNPPSRGCSPINRRHGPPPEGAEDEDKQQ
ncbi:transmembrane protein, putative [Medicago truncatula]|uniref:Transmembrane protein, putative n=1 Tax=Medicago truncatula TaxID=3880 RepID=A2Q696_MEDTR|nr:hypothetical protein MtrDRAFT_AC174465g9v2 [Medicago truncatula]AES65492.1 transmembrane protein, putative [Medicago truncatula]